MQRERQAIDGEGRDFARYPQNTFLTELDFRSR